MAGANDDVDLMPDAPVIRAVVFDFDGVLVESGDIKTEAFRELFSEWPECVDDAVDHHLRNLGKSRYEKFDWIFRELLGRPLTPRQRDDLGRRYSDMVLERVVECPPVPGATALLEALRGRVATAIASGTPEDELESIVERRGLRGFFDEVHGSPATKVRILRRLLERFAVKPGEMLMVGDGLSDYRAASAVGTHFVLRRTPAQVGLFEGVETRGVDDLRELRSWIESPAAEGRSRGFVLSPSRRRAGPTRR